MNNVVSAIIQTRARNQAEVWRETGETGRNRGSLNSMVE